MPASFSRPSACAITQAYRRAFSEQVQPAMASLLGFLKARTCGLPHERPASRALPTAPRSTRTWCACTPASDLTPDADPLRSGCSEVARIRGEIAKVQADSSASTGSP